MSEIPESEQPGQPDRSLAPRKERFALSRQAWTAYFLGVLVILSTVPFQRVASYRAERLVPYVSGLLLGLLLISILPSLLVFYISRRSHQAASITFMVFVALGALGQVAEVARNRGGILDDEAVLNRVGPAFLGWLKEQATPYQQACEKMGEKSPFQPSWLKERAELASAREQVLRVRKANGELRDLHDRMLPAIRRLLAAQGVREEDQSRLAAVISGSFAKTRTIFAALRDQDDGITAEFLKAFDLLEANWGHWSFDADAGAVVFENDIAAKEFEAARAKIEELAQAQQRDSAEFLRAMKEDK